MEKNKNYTFYHVEEIPITINFEDLYKLIKEEHYNEDLSNKRICDIFDENMDYYVLQICGEDIDPYDDINDYVAIELYSDFEEWLNINIQDF